VWQNAFEAAMRIFQLTKCFPPEERFSMTDQIRRSSRSVAANISEAWCKRRYKAAFIAKLNDAVSEAAETQTWLQFALRCQYLTEADVADLNDRYDHVIGQLVTMSIDHSKWTLHNDEGAGTDPGA
jgi:four helix bundle protein